MRWSAGWLAAGLVRSCFNPPEAQRRMPQLVHVRGRQGLVLMRLGEEAAVFGFGGSFISLLISKWMAKRSTGTQLIDTPRTPEERWLVETVSDLAREAGIGMPEVGIFPAQQSNAFATGWNRNKALVAVSAGLLQRFNKDEIRAVLGHDVIPMTNSR